MSDEIDLSGHYYIGRHDCRVATCPHRQEFPDGDSPYCVLHSLEQWIAEAGDSA